MSPFGCVRSVWRLDASASMPSKCPAVLLHRVNTNNLRPSNKCKGGQKYFSTFGTEQSVFTSHRLLQRSVQFNSRPLCWTSRVHFCSSARRLRFFPGPSELVLQRERGHKSRSGFYADSAIEATCASVTFGLLCSCGESCASRSLTTSPIVLASLLLMCSPLFACCRQKQEADKSACELGRAQRRLAYPCERETNARRNTAINPQIQMSLKAPVCSIWRF